MTTNVTFCDELNLFIQKNTLLCALTCGLAILVYCIGNLAGRTVSWIAKGNAATQKVDDVGKKVLNDQTDKKTTPAPLTSTPSATSSPDRTPIVSLPAAPTVITTPLASPAVTPPAAPLAPSVASSPAKTTPTPSVTPIVTVPPTIILPLATTDRAPDAPPSSVAVGIVDKKTPTTPIQVIFATANQYTLTSKSCCALASLMFAVSNDPSASPQMMDKIFTDLKKNYFKAYLKEHSTEPGEALEVMAEIDEAIKAEEGIRGYTYRPFEDFGVTFNRSTKENFEAGIKTFIDAKFRSAMLFTFGATMGIRKTDDGYLELFDSHGETASLLSLGHIAPEQNSNKAFVVRFHKTEYKKIVELINRIYPNMGTLADLGKEQFDAITSVTLFGYY